MTRKYFQNVTTKEELRKAYLKLARINHPDNGGDAEVFKAIQNEYDYLSKILKSAGATTEQEKKQKEYDDNMMDEAIKEMIDKIITMNGINIEIVGSWVWVDGNTYQYRETLKTLGFKWSKARSKWHYTPYDTGYHKGKKKDFDTLRQMYGSDIVNTKTVFAIGC